MNAQRRIRETAVGMAAFTLLAELLDELEQSGVFAPKQAQKVIKRAIKRSNESGEVLNTDAAYLLSCLRDR